MNIGERSSSVPSRVDHEAAAVEHQVVLTADLVHVDHRGADLGRTTLTARS